MEVTVSDSHDLVREWLDVEGVGPHGLNPEDGPTLVRGTHQDGTGVYAALYADQDYIQQWLLEVHTYRPTNDGRSVCVVDCLWACDGPSKLETAWFGEPRLFFDRDSDWYTDSGHWFVDQMAARLEQQHEAHTRSHAASTIAGLEASNEKVRQAERDRAKQIGIYLPVRGTPTNYSRRNR